MSYPHLHQCRETRLRLTHSIASRQIVRSNFRVGFSRDLVIRHIPIGRKNAALLLNLTHRHDLGEILLVGKPFVKAVESIHVRRGQFILRPLRREDFRPIQHQHLADAFGTFPAAKNEDTRSDPGPVEQTFAQRDDRFDQVALDEFLANLPFGVATE